MSKEGSVAPKERVNITYKPATGEAQEQKELPLQMLVLGDFTGRPDDRTIEERAPVKIDKDNFDQVMAEHKLTATVSVPNTLSEEPGAELHLDLKFETLADFTPDGIVHQVPELQKLLELRNALVALKGPLGNTPAFRRKIQALLGDESARKKLMEELGISEG